MFESVMFELSVCICTRNRPNEIRRALQSLSDCQRHVREVIVSDDSTNEDTYDIVKDSGFPVRYIRGPKRGLSANRNNALQLVTGTHVLFIDDDVVVNPEFIPCIIRHYEGILPKRRPSVIVTGLENKQGELVFPHEQSFLGFQKKSYGNSSKIRTIVINSTIFPVAVFQKIKFDENLVYGYEEVDIATRASYTNFEIELCSAAINNHYPSEINRDFYRPYVHASRLYVTFKRYLYSERRPCKAVIFAMIAINHLIATSVVHYGISGGFTAVRAGRLAMRYVIDGVRTAPRGERVK